MDLKFICNVMVINIVYYIAALYYSAINGVAENFVITTKNALTTDLDKE